MSREEFFRRVAKAAGPRAEQTEPKRDPRFSETQIGPTIHGGTYEVAYYYNKDRKPCPKKDAAFVNIVEYDSNDRRINEVYATIG